LLDLANLIKATGQDKSPYNVQLSAVGCHGECIRLPIEPLLHPIKAIPSFTQGAIFV